MVAFTTKTETFPEPLDVPEAVAAGNPLFVDRLEAIELQVSGTFSATIQPQISLDGVNWEDVGAAITAVGLATIANTARFIRANVTVYVSGTPVVVVDGREQGSP